MDKTRDAVAPRRRNSTRGDKPQKGLGGPSAGEGVARKDPDSWRKPLLADLLRAIHLRSSVFFRPEFGAPWGVRIANHGTAFHIVVRGSCWLHIKGTPKAVLLSAGDFVAITHANVHIIRDAPETAAVDYFKLVKSHPPGKDGVFRAGGEGRVTKLVCGGMEFENGATNPLLTILPPLLHLKATGRGAPPWLRRTLKHVIAELDSGESAVEVVTRLADILFIQAVRSYFDQNMETAEFGWLATVRDQRIGPAIALLHGQPDKPWTIASLARRVAMSRSAFADTFTKLVGDPPFRYLTRLRVDAAATRVRSTNDGLKAIAAKAGYESVAAFTRVFRRHMGMTPGEYRKVSRTVGSA